MSPSHSPKSCSLPGALVEDTYTGQAEVCTTRAFGLMGMSHCVTLDFMVTWLVGCDIGTEGTSWTDIFLRTVESEEKDLPPVEMPWTIQLSSFPPGIYNSSHVGALGMPLYPWRRRRSKCHGRRHDETGTRAFRLWRHCFPHPKIRQVSL